MYESEVTEEIINVRTNPPYHGNCCSKFQDDVKLDNYCFVNWEEFNHLLVIYDDLDLKLYDS